MIRGKKVIMLSNDRRNLHLKISREDVVKFVELIDLGICLTASVPELLEENIYSNLLQNIYQQISQYEDFADLVRGEEGEDEEYYYSADEIAEENCMRYHAAVEQTIYEDLIRESRQYELEEKIRNEVEGKMYTITYNDLIQEYTTKLIKDIYKKINF